MLSKPAAESSGGSSALTSTSSASRSRIALAYSGAIQTMQRRRAGVERRAAARSSADSSAAVNVSRARRRPGRAVGRHHPGAQLAHHLLPHLGVPVDRRGSSASSASPPLLTRALWQPTQYCFRNAASGAAAATAERGGEAA